MCVCGGMCVPVCGFLFLGVVSKFLDPTTIAYKASKVLHPPRQLRHPKQLGSGHGVRCLSLILFTIPQISSSFLFLSDHLFSSCFGLAFFYVFLLFLRLFLIFYKFFILAILANSRFYFTPFRGNLMSRICLFRCKINNLPFRESLGFCV